MLLIDICALLIDICLMFVRYYRKYVLDPNVVVEKWHMDWTVASGQIWRKFAYLATPAVKVNYNKHYCRLEWLVA